MRKIFDLPDEVILQLFKKARNFILAAFIILSFVISFVSTDKLIASGISISFIFLIQGAVWLSLKTKKNFNLIILPVAFALLFFSDQMQNSETPFYIISLVFFVYINLFIPNRIIRIIYLCLLLLLDAKIIFPIMEIPDVLRILVSYFVAAFTMFFLVDYIRKIEHDVKNKYEDITEIFNSSPLPIVLFEMSGKITLINDACLDLFGFTKEELKDKELRDIYYFASNERANELLRYFKMAVEENKTIRIEEEYKKRKGEIISISANIKPIELHGEKYILFIGQDVTKELNMRKELQRTHKLYRTMAANIPNSAVFMFDTQLRFLLVEGEDFHKSDLNKNKFIGKTFRESFSTDVANYLEEYFKATLLGIEASVEIEDNGKQYVYYFLPVRAENNKIMSGIALSVNITELKQSKSEINIKTRMIDAYAHKASHLVRKPVASLLGLADILLNHENSEEEKRTIVKFIYDTVKELDENLKEAAVELNK